MVETQFLGVRFMGERAQTPQYSRVTLYRMIDALVLEHNRLSNKMLSISKEKSTSTKSMEDILIPPFAEISHIAPLADEKHNQMHE